MSTPVAVWFVNRGLLAGPQPATAILRQSISGSSYWAELVDFGPRQPGFPRNHYARGHRYKIGTTVFLTELAAQRFLAGEADRAIKTATWYNQQYQQRRLAKAEHIPHPSVYRKKHDYPFRYLR